MAEPARKLQDIKPNIRPQLGSIQGGGQSTPERASLSALNNLESNPEKPNKESVANQEANGSNVIQGPWANNVSGAEASPSKLSGRFSGLKKKGPLTAIILTLVGGSIGIGGLLSPGLLLVNMKEVMVNKFDSQLASMTGRTSKLLTNKLTSQATSGVLCGSVISIGCKYSTMSEKMLSNFDEAGIKVNYEDKTFFGRAKPTSFEFDGETIKAGDIKSKIASDPEFGAAMDKAYNPKFAGFKDKIWSWVEGKLGISEKAAPLDGDTDAEKLKSVQEDTSNPAPADDLAQNVDTSDIDPDTGDPYTAEQAATANSAADTSNDILEGAKEVAESGDTVADDVLIEAEASTSAASTGANVMKITGLADGACTAYGAMQAVGYAAKTVRAVQLARYAMLFLNVADQIKAGVAKPEDVSYLGKVLTTEVADGAGAMKTATDSFGYKFAAYGDRGAMSTSATRFLAGGGMTGSLIVLSGIIDGILGHLPKKTCGLLKNPIVSTGSLLVGVGMFFVPGANAPYTWQKGAQAAGILALNVAAMFLPAMLKDIVAGILVDKNTVGEAAGDALTSGASGMMSNAAKAGGNAPLTPQQAVAYNNLTNEVIAQYAEKDRLTHSPFDVTNSNTFLGTIAAGLLPYASKMSSLSGVMSSIASITSGSFASITSPTTKATSVDDYTMCQDFDYNDIKSDGSKVKLATDPYCNVAYGVPPEALNADPIEVANALVTAGEIDSQTGEPLAGSKYETFITNCINRERPLGDSGANQTDSNGSECLFTDSNKNYYIHYIDQRVQSGMDGEVQTNSSTPTGGSSVGDSEQPADTKAANKGWTLKDSVDYSGVPCAEGSTDKSTYTHPTKHFTIRLCDTKLGKVSSLISQRVVDMVNAAKKDGVNLAGSSWRSYEAQQQLRADNCSRGHCSPPTASPGNSQHERGIGTDFGAADKGGAVWNWLEANGAKYGYHNLPSENWHWSMSGG